MDAFYLDTTTVFFDDVVRQVKSETGATANRARGKKRFEEMRPIFLCDAGSRIGNRDTDSLVVCRVGTDRDHALIWYGLQSVAENMKKDLI